MHLELLLELFNRLRAARNRRRGTAGGGAVNEVPLPVLDRGSLLAVEPELGEGLARGAEELRNHVGGVENILVGRVVGERGGRRHDVAVDVTTAAEGGGACVGDGGNDGLEVLLLYAMDLSADSSTFQIDVRFERRIDNYLKRLAGGGPDITLTVLGGQVVDDLVDVRRNLTTWNLETKHKLE